MPNCHDSKSIINCSYNDLNDFHYYNEYELVINGRNIEKIKIIGIYELNDIVNIIFEIFAIISDGDIYPFFIKYKNIKDKKDIMWDDLIFIKNINMAISGDDIFYKSIPISEDSFMVDKDLDRLFISPIYDIILPNDDHIIRRYSSENIYKDFSKTYMPRSISEIADDIYYIINFPDMVNKGNGLKDIFTEFEYILFNMNIINKKSNIHHHPLDFIYKFKNEIGNIDLINNIIKKKFTKGNNLIHSSTNIFKEKNSMLNSIWYPKFSLYRNLTYPQLSLYQNLLLSPITELDIVFKDILNIQKAIPKFHINYAYNPIEMSGLEHIKDKDLIGFIICMHSGLKDMVHYLGYHKHNKNIDVRLIRNFHEQIKIVFKIGGEDLCYTYLYDLFFLPLICDGIMLSA